MNVWREVKNTLSLKKIFDMEVEVKESALQEVDWTDNPQLVSYKLRELIVLVHKDQQSAIDDDTFSGTCLDGDCLSANNWAKEAFIPFHGEITLKNG